MALVPLIYTSQDHYYSQQDVRVWPYVCGIFLLHLFNVNLLCSVSAFYSMPEATHVTVCDLRVTERTAVMIVQHLSTYITTLIAKRKHSFIFTTKHWM